MNLTQRITEVLQHRVLIKKKREEELRHNVVRRIDEIQQRKARPLVFPLP